MIEKESERPNFTNTELNKAIEQWLSWDKNEKTLMEVQCLVKEGNEKILKNLFLNRLEFGTAGLRARMGPGYNQINDLVIIQTTQGLCEYVTKCFKDFPTKGVVLGYDGRYNSKRFAELAAAVFVRKNIKVYLFSQICPTPFVAFGVRELGSVIGIMITASHNPKEDNGYKLYWNNGAQIIPPHDKEIQKCILNNLKPNDQAWDTSILFWNTNVVDPLPDIMNSYYCKLKQFVVHEDLNATSPISIAYTAMHGVGYHYLVKAFEVANLKEFYPVLEQAHPDPEFPTVQFPNPEEGKSALNLSIETANRHNCTLILANDPDADRLAVAEKDIIDGSWKIFNGNELGALLGWWSLLCYKHLHPNVRKFEDVYMLSSTVSSKILNSMAKKEGFNFEETLTGFKWMGNVADRLISDGKKVLFAFEEAIGFMCGTSVLDKDGVSAAVKVAELASFLMQQFNMTLKKKLEDIYSTYGQHLSLNSYFICHDSQVIRAIFHRIRNFLEETNQSYPFHILNGKYAITGVRDLTTGYDDAYLDKKAKLPSSKSSQMITFSFTNGLVATMRTSGTEPKIKYYSELCASPKQRDKEVLLQILKEMVNALIEEFLQPKINGLKPRPNH